jgi:hypothetical protein
VHAPHARSTRAAAALHRRLAIWTRLLTPRACAAPQVRVVYVVLEAQYQSSLSAAVRNLNEKRTDVAYEARLRVRACARAQA